MHLRVIGKSLGALFLILAVAGLGPLGADWLTGRPLSPWLAMEATMLLVGLALVGFGRHAGPDDMGLREGIAVTTLLWFCGSALAGVGLWLGSPLTFIEAWFEAMSGVTTTGATVYGEERSIEDQSAGVKLWRAQLQWIGGIGIVVISLALLPLLIGGGGFKAFRAEVPGLDNTRLAPRIRDTAFILYKCYLALTMLVFVGLLLCGVGGFDAICHAMTTVATAGFSTYDDSVEGLGSAAAEWVIVGGMLVAGCNFGLLLAAISGKPMRLLRSSEFRLYLALIVGASIALAILLAAGAEGYDGRPHDLIRDSVFQAVAICTTTGYCTGYDVHPLASESWPAAARLILIMLMIGGGCAGSTAGGVKLVRFLVAWRGARRELRRYLEPARVTPIRLGGHELGERTVLQVGTFIFLYFACWAIGSLLFAVLGLDLETATTAALSCLSNIGPAMGDVGPSEHWTRLGPLAHLLAIALMLIGRLELLGVLLMLRWQSWTR